MAKKSSFIEEAQKRTRTSVLEYINKNKSKPVVSEAEAPSIGPDLALNLFGKIYGGDPSTGIVPGARPMNREERLEIGYNVCRDILKKNGHDPDLADKWFMEWFGKTYK